jgi:hypothetical protein
MQQRSRNISVLAFSSVMVGLYSFMAGIALLWAGAIVSFIGNDIGGMVFALGTLFLAQSIAAYVVGAGLWLQKSWAWAGATVVFVTLTVLNVAVALAATNFSAVALPLIGSIAGLALLNKPSVKAQLIGAPEDQADTTQTPAMGDAVKTAA